MCRRCRRIEQLLDVVLADKPAGEWNTLRVVMVGARVSVWLNGKQTVDFTEPEGWTPPKGMAGRKLGNGTFAIQAHDPGCKVDYKDLVVERLP